MAAFVTNKVRWRSVRLRHRLVEKGKLNMYNHFNRPEGPCECERPPMGPECDKPCGPQGDCCVVPPPIPPIKWVPGFNSQEQLGHVVSRVNECICQWNKLQKNCCEALENMVNAAVTNNVYYGKKEVRLSYGFSIDDNCNFEVIDIACVDKCGKPIFVHLKPAFGNQANSGVRENMSDASYMNSANAIITAVSPENFGWSGPTMFDGKLAGSPMPIDEQESWVCGFNRHGTLLVFPASIDTKILLQSRMVNCIGPVYPIIENGEVNVQGIDGDTPMAVQAIGWRACDGSKVFFSCGKEESPGMKVANVAAELKRMGCTTAVVTCAMSAYPSGTKTKMLPAEPGETGKNMTGGMQYIGKQTDVPLNYQTPYNSAFWVVSRKPGKQWDNDFCTEIANLNQLYGRNANDLSNLGGAVKDLQGSIGDAGERLDNIEDEIADINAVIDNIESDVKTIQSDINSLQTRTENLENGLKSETEAREAEDEKLAQAVADEATARGNADAEIRADVTKNAEGVTKNADAIAKETSDRIAADAELAKRIQDEAAARNQGDANLATALQNEANARQTMDAALEAKIAAAKAASEQEDQKLRDEIQEILSGEAELPKATKTKFGVVKIGDGLEVGADGALNAVGNGDTVIAGDGITIDANGDEKTISVTPGVYETVEDAKAAHEELTGNITIVNNKVDTNTHNIANNLKGIEALEKEDDSLREEINTVKSEVEKIVSGETPVTAEIPVATATALGGIKVGANLTVTEDGVLSAQPGGGESGETTAAGYGITIDHQGNVATISADTDIIATAESVRQAEKTASDALTAAEDRLDAEIAGTKADLTAEATARETADAEHDREIAEISGDVKSIGEQVNELVDGTGPYVKKTGDTMTGELEVNSDVVSSMGPRGVSVSSKNGTAGIGMTVDAAGAIIEAKSGVLWVQKEGGSPIAITNLSKGVDDTDAVTFKQLKDTDSKLSGQIADHKADTTAQIATVTADVAKNGNDIASANQEISSNAARIEALEDSVSGIESGATDLNYVKKTGDTMSGVLTITGGSSSKVEVANGGTKTSVKPNGLFMESNVVDNDEVIPLAGGVTMGINGLMLGSNLNKIDCNLSELIQVKDGTADNSAATLKQLEARVKALEALLTPQIEEAKTAADAASKAVADAGLESGPFLPTAGGVMTGNITMQNSSVVMSTAGAKVIGPTNLFPTVGRVSFGFEQSGNYKNVRLQGIANPAFGGDAINLDYFNANKYGSYAKTTPTAVSVSTGVKYTTCDHYKFTMWPSVDLHIMQVQLSQITTGGNIQLRHTETWPCKYGGTFPSFMTQHFANAILSVSANSLDYFINVSVESGVVTGDCMMTFIWVD